MRQPFALVVALMLVSPAIAPEAEAGGGYTAAMLVESCKSDDDLGAGLCAGFIVGTLAGYTLGLMGRPSAYCVPSGVTVDQLRQIIMKGAADRPETLHIEANLFVVHAIIEVFPCQ